MEVDIEFILTDAKCEDPRIFFFQVAFLARFTVLVVYFIRKKDIDSPVVKTETSQY